MFRAIKWSDIDEQIEGGIRLMGQIAIIMLVAGGYASVIKATGGIDALVNAGISAVGGSKAVAAVVITLIGLLVTMGIGTSFGTVPVLAVLFVPMCSSLGFSTPATILLISAAAALGDAARPRPILRSAQPPVSTPTVSTTISAIPVSQRLSRLIFRL